MSKPRVWADVDLDAISNNLGVVRSRLGHGNVMLVVKADAYGHGAVRIARHVLERGEASAFGVGDSTEALELREAGIAAPLLILGAIVDGEMDDVVRNDIAVCAHSLERVRRLERVSRRLGRVCRVHVMVDTGMGRLGPFEDRAVEVATAVWRSDWLELEGIATHFSSSNRGDDAFTDEQIARFDSFRARIAACGVEPGVIHAANSGAVLNRRAASFGMARIGAAAYGLLVRDLPDPHGLIPALALRTQIIYLKDVPAGTPISYNRLHVTERKTRIATLPIGYNDGLPYALSNRGAVLVRGQRAPIVGAVSMDYCMVDVGGIPGVRVGDEVTCIGVADGASLLVPEIGEMLQTVPYELTCGLGKRVVRRFHPAARHPALEDCLQQVHGLGRAPARAPAREAVAGQASRSGDPRDA